MPKPDLITLTKGSTISILYEDPAVLAVDKPAGWLLAPESWDKTGRNLHLALQSSLAAGDYWARSRHLRFLRFIHRLDADTSGVLLLARQPSVVAVYSRLFASHQVEKVYLAVVQGIPARLEWRCRFKLAPDPRAVGRMVVDARQGKAAETSFRVLQTGRDTALVEARPRTGRTHQVRVHLAAAGLSILNDPLYGPATARRQKEGSTLALRAIAISYHDPFRHRLVNITAPSQAFLERYGFAI